MIRQEQNTGKKLFIEEKTKNVAMKMAFYGQIEAYGNVLKWLGKKETPFEEIIKPELYKKEKTK